MTYTVRYAHLASTELKVGQKIQRGDCIGVMGNTGQSKGRHLHIDCVKNKQVTKYTLQDIENEKYVSAPRQLNYFIDNELLASPFIITTHYACPKYMRDWNKVHLGYDIISAASLFGIFWNRSMTGEVVQILHNDPGYGNCVYIAYESK